MMFDVFLCGHDSQYTYSSAFFVPSRLGQGFCGFLLFLFVDDDGLLDKRQNC